MSDRSQHAAALGATPPPAAFSDLTDLANALIGGVTLEASDDFFAEKENLLKPEEPIYKPDVFTDRGKWMDGWESRRKRTAGHDWCTIRLGVPGEIRGLNIDTRHFLGNHPPYASVDACVCPEGDPDAQGGEWVEILSVVPLREGTGNLFTPHTMVGAEDQPFTHVRLNIYPDGGVARLRVYGVPRPPQIEASGHEVDLAAAAHGARALCCSDNFFSPMQNLVLPGEPSDMGGGWESRRRRQPGHDWIIVQLAAPGRVHGLQVDTRFFKGNYPAACTVEGLCWPGAPMTDLIKSDRWQTLLPEQQLGPDGSQAFVVHPGDPITHVRLNIFPDGGISRLRIWGKPVEALPARDDALARALNTASPPILKARLTRCCGSTRWAEAMVAARPFADEAAALAAAEAAADGLDREDWLEAFSHHPRIGEDTAALRAKFASTATWSAGEQAGVSEASEATLKALAEGNREYFDRFGYIFIVCATGLSAEAMLSRLQARLPHDPADELQVAAAEQRKITGLRLKKLADEAT